MQDDGIGRFVNEAQAMLTGRSEHAFGRKESVESSDSVFRSSSSEDDGTYSSQPAPFYTECLRVQSVASENCGEPAGTINHSGFFGYEAMMGESPGPDIPRHENPTASLRRRVLPASRDSTGGSSGVQRPSFGSTPEDLSATPSASKLLWGEINGVKGDESSIMSERIQPCRRAPLQTRQEAQSDMPTARVLGEQHAQSKLTSSVSRGEVVHRVENMHSKSVPDEQHWHVTTANTYKGLAGLLNRNDVNQNEHEQYPARRRGHREAEGSLAMQTEEYGRAAGTLESLESNTFAKLKAVRVLGKLHAGGMFEARQPLLRTVDHESRMLRIAAIHELMAAPAASHTIGMEQSIELGRVLTRILDERDDSTGARLQVVSLNALAHFGKSGTVGIGDSYTLGLIVALCESQDADVRGAAVKAIGSLCKPLDSHYCDRVRPRLQDSDATVREHAVRTLAKIGAWGGNDAFAADLLRVASSDPNPSVQRAAVDALVASLNGDQSKAARAVMKRAQQHCTQEFQLPPLVRVMLEE